MRVMGNELAEFCKTIGQHFSFCTEINWNPDYCFFSDASNFVNLSLNVSISNK